MSSWQHKVFLTFDMDWACDNVLASVLDILEEYRINVTVFVTHYTPLLQRMRENHAIELGIHPNFNPLLQGDFCYGRNVNEVIEFYLKIVPDAKVVRSHALVQGGNISKAFAFYNLTHECNVFIPASSQIKLCPWRSLYKNLIYVPHFWEDDVFLLSNDEADLTVLTEREGIRVFNFHPIHVFINSENIERYNRIRSISSDFEQLKSHINQESDGIKDFLLKLLENGCAKRN